MASYTFYPRRANGSALAFETVEIVSAAQLNQCVRKLFRDHTTAVEIEVCEGDLRLAVYARQEVEGSP